MTDEELKAKLLQKTYGRAHWPQAVARIEKLQARIEELRAFAQFVIEQLDAAALDDCASAYVAGQYLNDYRHTRKAAHKIRGRAAELFEGTDDEG